MQKIQLAILGCGNMGSALGVGLSKTKHPFSLTTFDPLFEKSKSLAQKIKGMAVKNIHDLKDCEYFLIACKPQQFVDLATELKPILSANSKIISILAGTPIAKIKKFLRVSKIARVMPNTPCLIGEGVCVFYFSGMHVREQKIISQIFKPVAEIFFAKSEDQVDLATALTGSGPAYFFEIARILSHAAAQLGFKLEEAEKMVKQLCKGSGLLMTQTSETLETLRNQVTSKKGTTEAALKTFKKEKLEKVLEKGLKAAYLRAKELSRS